LAHGITQSTDGGGSAAALRRVVTACTPTVVVGAATAAAAQWVHWLHPGAAVAAAAAPAVGVVLAALLLLAPSRWPGPLAAGALAVGAVSLADHLGAGLAIGAALATVAAATTAAVLLRWYGGGRFGLARVQELLALIVAAALGAVVGAAIATFALALARDLSSGDLWRAAWQYALADGFGMVLVGAAVLTMVEPPGPARHRGGRLEAVALALAVVLVSAFALGRWDDPLAFSAALVLGWAALRFGPRGVALSAVVMVGVASWAAARTTGPFTALTDPSDAVVVLQMFVAVTLFAMLALALALDERDAAEAARWAATERFRRTFHDSPVAMAVATLDGRIVETNRALCELLGQPDHRLVGTTLRSLRAEDSGEHEVTRSAAAGSDTLDPPESRLVNARGESVWVEITENRLRRQEGTPELVVVVLRDVTERKGLQQQLLHAQKMESVGRLAGGIAHDFNNVLAIMRGQVELLQDDLEVLESARARIDSVQRATDRAAALTDDLMAFSRQRVDEPEAFDLHDLLRGVRELLHQVLGATVALELHLDASPATIVADPNRIEQAVLNLAVNARDAMPTGGRLTITTSTGPTPSRAVTLTATDTGAGMDAATQARVFEPFFTTKPPGLGTGLGLSTTDDIIRSAGGTIEVRSERGKGTTFTLTFPAPAVEVPGLGRDAVDDLIDLTENDGPTVLVVDDESEVRTLIAEILRGAGYRVVAAPDGDAAIALLGRAGHSVDLLVTDVVMPVMSGTDLAARVTEQFPGTRVLFVSGFVPAGSAALRGAPLVTKPLRRTELLDAVLTVLGDGPRSADQGTKR
jgi:two-component system, cell cycle sensor histidine kinase and response regulator CckA